MPIPAQPVSCVEPSWASGPYGTIAWGGSLSASPGGPLPTSAPFDIYCVGPCGPMSVFSTYTGMDLVADVSSPSPHLYNDVDTQDFVIASGGVTTPYCAHVGIPTTFGADPQLFTIELTFKITSIPTDDLDLANRHVGFVVGSETGCTVGFFFTETGISYTGSVTYGAGYDGLGMVLNSPVQLLPDSLNVVLPDVYYTMRVAVDSINEVAYVYITETELIPTIGQQLLYVLPALLSTSGLVPTPDETILTAAGTALEPSVIQFAEVCLAHGLLVPNFPPVALAGSDQSSRLCTIVRFDGRASFDPQGAALTYKWRLIGAPDPSIFVFNGEDGATFGFPADSNKLYSSEAQAYNTTNAIQPGDVLSVNGTPYNITNTGTDITGFYIQIDGFALPGNLVSTSFSVLRQYGVAGATSSQPTFYPDVMGVFYFDLIVFNGNLYSTPSKVIVDVLESHVPRGITPDLSFLWNYISDFWKLVSNTEIIDVFWGALGQIAAAEMLTLWQTEYSKSLRDIQRTFQRRWLHYDLYIQEPLIDLTTVRSIYGGMETVDIPSTGIAGVEGTIVITQPFAPPFTVFLTPRDPAHFLPGDIQAQLQRQLYNLNTGFSINLYQNANTGVWRILVTAPFPFSFDASSTSAGLFTIPAANDLPQGMAGVATAANTYFVEKSLQYAGIQPGDFLVVDGIAYTILLLTTAKGDPYTNQRIVTSDPLPTTMGSDWTIAGATDSSFIDFYAAMCSAGDVAVYEVVELSTNALTYVQENVLSAGQDGSLLTEQLSITPFTANPSLFSVYFYGVYRRTYYPVDALVTSVPAMQALIVNTDDTAVLRENVDYFLETYRGNPCIRFVTSTTGGPDVWQGQLPEQRMWAEVTYIDNNPVIEQNFGFLAGFTLGDLAQLPSNTDYLSVVRGLWYSYWNGPTLFDLRVGTQILLGLPFAEEVGTISQINLEYSPTQSQILITDASNTGIVRSYDYPNSLSLEINPSTNLPYAVGDTVQQFAPLTTGAEVDDYISDPTWFQGYLEQGSFYEVEKFFKFLVRINSAAFSLTTLSYVQSFILKIKPTYTYPLFVVQAVLPDQNTEVDTSDSLFYSGKLLINTWPGNYAIAGLGGTGLTKIGGSFDDPRSAGGGWWSEFDGDYPLSAPAVFPSTIVPIHWGFDKQYLVPDDVIIGTLTMTWAGGIPVFDSIWSFDLPVMDDGQGSVVVAEASITVFPTFAHKLQLGGGPVVNDPPVGTTENFYTTVTENFSLQDVIIEYRAASKELSPLALGYEIQVYSDNTLSTLLYDITDTFNIPASANGYKQALPVPGAPFAVNAGNVVQVFVYAAGASQIIPTTAARVFFHFGTAVPWAFDTTFPAGDYLKVQGM